MIATVMLVKAIAIGVKKCAYSTIRGADKSIIIFSIILGIDLDLG
jgi:hypothetical protein